MDTNCKIGWVGRLKIHAEGDEFEPGEVVHNHIDCPACGKQDARTDAYSEIERGENIRCQECRAIFKPTSLLWYFEDSLTWERIA